MGGKHLKKLRAEKSKVKLKKKTLPKGQNITDTSFKVKKIVTVEQLKKVDENEPVSSWNVPLKDLLIRLKHYNYTSRLNALNGIKELLTNYQDILSGPSLKLLVERVLELLTDDEHKIRVTAIELMNHIFGLLPSTSIIPFHSILNVYLCCAMTHRNAAVQRDSLKFVDLMINYAPEAVKYNFKTLAQNLTRIIKANLYGSQSGVSLKGSQQELEKSRTEMFFRFYQFLSIAYSTPEEGKRTEGRVINVKSLRNKRRIALVGCNGQYKKIPNMPSLFKKSETEKKIVVNFDPNEFKSQCLIIVPLVFDTWMEFSPTQSPDGPASDHVLTESVGALLHIIVRILLLLHERVLYSGDSDLAHWFISTYSQTFTKCFMSNFPYSLPANKPQMNISREIADTCSTSYSKPNLIICYLSYLFRITHKNVGLEAMMEQFVSNALMVKTPTGVDILSKLVVEVLKSSKRKKSDIFLSTVIQAHNSTNSPELRRRLSEILMKVVLENDESFKNNLSLSKWMTSLPEQLLKTRISLQVAETVLEIVKRPVGVQVLKEVEKRAEEILEKLPNAKIEGVAQFEGQKIVVNILYWCNNGLLEKVLNRGLLEKGAFSQPLKDYITDVFSYKLTSCLLKEMDECGS